MELLNKTLDWMEPLDLIDALIQRSKRGINFHNTEDNYLSKQGEIKILEIDLYKTLLPKDLYSTFFKMGIVGMYTMSFALRHRLSYLSEVFHYLYCQDQLLKEKIKKNFCEDFNSHIEAIHYYIMKGSFFSTIKNSPTHHIPILGFSAIGAHLRFHNRNTCRAFDHYDLPFCDEKTSQVYCKKHNQENWMVNTASLSLKQSHMFAFYANKNNFKQYNPDDLAQMFLKFNQALTDKAISIDPKLLQDAFILFELKDKHSLIQKGLPWLRHEFSIKAFRTHPDQGGDTSSFHNLKKCYDVLKSIL